MPFASHNLRGRGFKPPTPVMTRGNAQGKFTISVPTYLAYAQYVSTTQTQGAGSPIGTVTGADVQLPTSGTQIAYVTGSVGLQSPGSGYAERKDYTYTTSYFVQTGFYTYNGPCGPGATCYGTCGGGSQNCGVPQGYYACCVKDPTPANYQDSYNEWWKAT